MSFFLVKEFDDWCNYSSVTAEFAQVWPYTYSQCPSSPLEEANQDPQKQQRINECIHLRWMEQKLCDLYGMMKKYEKSLTLQLFNCVLKVWMIVLMCLRKNPCFWGVTDGDVSHQPKSPRFRWQLDSAFWAPSTPRQGFLIFNFSGFSGCFRCLKTSLYLYLNKPFEFHKAFDFVVEMHSWKNLKKVD